MGKTILAIDDEQMMLDFYQIVLAEFGEVRAAINLKDARSQLEGVDLIVLDFYLQQDQYLIQELIPELTKAAPVLLCSGIQDVMVPTMGAKFGIAGYWNKGSDHDKLRSLVRSVLTQSTPASG